jgi:hypothetical protein
VLIKVKNYCNLYKHLLHASAYTNYLHVIIYIKVMHLITQFSLAKPKDFGSAKCNYCIEHCEISCFSFIPLLRCIYSLLFLTCICMVLGVGIAQLVQLWAGWLGFSSQQGKIFLFFAASRPALGFTQPPIQWVPWVFPWG